MLQEKIQNNIILVNSAFRYKTYLIDEIENVIVQ
jgi:hypothetical protein